jgi:hypothetical protein
MVGDVVSDTVYYVPYAGDTVSVFLDSKWKAIRLTGSVSLLVSTFTANTVFDVFLGHNGSVWSMSAVEWTSDSVRSEELNLLDGILVNGSDNSKRYVGTVRTNGSGQVEATKINYCIWNAYNQKVVDINTRWAQTWTYATNKWAPYGNNSVNGQARVSFVCGLPANIQMVSNQTSRFAYTGVSLNALVGGYLGTPGYNQRTDSSVTSPAFASGTSEVGYNFVQSIVYGLSGATNLTECETRGSFLA